MSGPIVQVLFKGRMLKSLSFESGRLRIGRMRENDIVINNLSVSRFHAELHRRDGKTYLEDCDSENGCFVNGERIQEAEIDVGDEILIGKHQLVLREPETGESGDALTGPGERGPSDPWDGEKTYVMGAEGMPALGVAPPPPATDEADPVAAPGELPGDDVAALHAVLAAQEEPDAISGDEDEDGTRMYAGLVLQRAGRFDRVLRWDQERMLVGRSHECEVVLSHPEISRRHALLVREDDRYEIRDLDSINGTHVNGTRVKRHVLEVGDVIKLEDFELTFVLEPRPIGEEVATQDPERPSESSEDHGITMLEERFDLGLPEPLAAPEAPVAPELQATSAPLPSAPLPSARGGREPGDPLPPARRPGPRAGSDEPALAEPAQQDPIAAEDAAMSGEARIALAAAPSEGAAGERLVTLELKVRLEDLPAMLRTAFEVAGEEAVRLPAELRLVAIRD